MLQRLGTRLSEWAERFVPDPFVFAIALTAIAFLLAWTVTDSSAGQVLSAWGKGFWN